MTVKFNQYWRIDPEKVPEYENYLLTKFIPGVNHLGIHIQKMEGYKSLSYQFVAG